MKRSVALVLLVFLFATAHAATFTVTNTNDSGAGSLRDAVAQANGTPGVNTITFASTAVGTITLTGSGIDITNGLNIVGPGQSDLAIAGHNVGLFRTYSVGMGCPAPGGSSDFPVSISGLTLRNGLGAGGAVLARTSLALDSVTIRDNIGVTAGGGVLFLARYAGQALTIRNSRFFDNVVKPVAGAPTFDKYVGGALAAAEDCDGLTASTMTIDGSRFAGNQVQPRPGADGYGGAIALGLNGPVVIQDTRIVDNHADSSPLSLDAGYYGGGIGGIAASVTIRRSEIAQNSADFAGGIGVINFNPNLQAAASAVQLAVIDSTVSGNVANQTGGGIIAVGNVAANVSNSTVAANVANWLNQDGVRVSGIGLATDKVDGPSGAMATAPTLRLVSSIVADGQASYPDIATEGVPLPFSVTSDNSLVQLPDPSVVLAGSGNRVAVDPLLATLSFNGAFTRSHALRPGSPALDAGDNRLNLVNDQRGQPFPRQVGAQTDIGAYEGVASANLQGVHWAVPAGTQSGEGFFFNQQGAQGESLFGAGYIYDTQRNPLWLVFALSRQQDGTYAGDAYTATGPSFANFNPDTAKQVVPEKAGTVTLKPGDSGDSSITFALDFVLPQQANADKLQAKASLTVNRTLDLTRQVFGYPVPTCGPGSAAEQIAATNYQDIWWAFPPNSESGWGLTVAHQGDTLFVAWFTYGANGHALWMVFSATKTAPNVYSGNVYTATGPSFDTVPFDPTKVTGTQVGTATLTFTDGANGTFSYTVNGITQSKPITRQLFAAVGNVCK